MSEIIIGSYRGKGAANQITDQVRTDSHVRPNGDHLAIAVIADGGQVGQSGGYIANIAADAALRYLQQGTETDISDLTINAVKFANRMVTPVLEESGAKGCALAVAVIHQNRKRKKLFVAHVGNAGIYLVREQKAIQLNREHTFKHIAPIEGKMDAETAACNPNANELLRSLGGAQELLIDIGFHVEPEINKNNYHIAQVRGMRGLPIKQGDSILLCTDGLIHNGDIQRLVQPSEISQVMETQEGEKAARVLVSFALGRNAQDNASAAVLQTEDPRRLIPPAIKHTRTRRQTVFFYGAVSTILLLCVVTGLLFFDGRDEALAASTPTAEVVVGALPAERGVEIQSKAQNVALVASSTEEPTATPLPTNTAVPTLEPTATEEVVAPPSPTPTLRPTLVPVPIGIQKYANEEEMRMLTEDEWIFAREDLELHIDTLGEDTNDASLYLEKGSEIEIDQVNDAVMFRLFDLSDVLIETGDYPGGSQIEARTPSDDVLFSVDGSCMAVAYNQAEQRLEATCFEGNCQYKIGRHSSVEIPTGQRVNLNPDDVEQTPVFEPISLAMALNYQTFLTQFVGGPDDIQSCLVPYFAPPPTAVPPSPTAIPTATAVPQQANTQNNPSPSTSNPQPAAGQPVAGQPVAGQPPVEQPTEAPVIIAAEVTRELVEPTLAPPTPTPYHEPTAPSNPTHPTPVPGHGPTTTPDPAHPTPTPGHGPTATPDPAHPTPTPGHGPTATPDHGQPTATPYHAPTETPVPPPTQTPSGEADVAPTATAYPPTSTPESP